MDWGQLLATTDRAVVSGLGRAVTYAPAVGAPVVVTGIYDDAHLETTAGVAGVTTSTPAVWLILDDLPTDPEVDEPTVTVGADVFSVAEVHKDSNGAGVTLLLRRGN